VFESLYYEVKECRPNLGADHDQLRSCLIPQIVITALEQTAYALHQPVQFNHERLWRKRDNQFAQDGPYLDTQFVL
jgi:hypothetical protein